MVGTVVRFPRRDSGFSWILAAVLIFACIVAVIGGWLIG